MLYYFLRVVLRCYECCCFTTFFILAEDTADNSIVKGPMTLVWAKGVFSESDESDAVFKV